MQSTPAKTLRVVRQPMGKLGRAAFSSAAKALLFSILPVPIQNESRTARPATG